MSILNTLMRKQEKVLHILGKTTRKNGNNDDDDDEVYVAMTCDME